MKQALGTYPPVEGCTALIISSLINARYTAERFKADRNTKIVPTKNLVLVRATWENLANVSIRSA